MKHLFLSYELSKQLKEKGFNLLTNHFYSESGKLFPRVLESGNEPVSFEPDDFYENFNTILKYEVEGKCQNVISAPLHQQVIDWFREKHNIIILVEVATYINSFNYRFYIETIDDKVEGFKTNNYYEALNKAIEEALELI